MKCSHFTCHACPDDTTTLRARVAALEAERDTAARQSAERAVQVVRQCVGALKGYHRVANSTAYAQWTPEMHRAENALSAAATLLGEGA